MYKNKILLSLIPLIYVGCANLQVEQKSSDLNNVSIYKNINQEKSSFIEYKNFINDDDLLKYLEIALNNNRNYKKSISNLEMIKNNYKIQKSNEYPDINLGLSGSKSKNLNNSITQNSSSTIGISNYEIDLYGKYKDLTEVEFENYLSNENNLKSYKISLVSQIITSWVNINYYKKMIFTCKKIEENSFESLNITKKRYELGIDDVSSSYNSEIIYNQSKVDNIIYKTKLDQEIKNFELLIGESINDDLILKSDFKELNKIVNNFNYEIKSEILLNRPDVLEAEHQLKSVQANIEAVRKTYFPTISLTSSYGLSSNLLSGLFTNGTSVIWNFIPNISMNLFDFDEKDSKLNYQISKRDYYISNYEYIVQNAFKEINNELIRKNTIIEQKQYQTNLLNSSYKSYEYYNVRYKNGVENFINVLNSQRTYYTSLKSLISLELEETENIINLYKVFGGSL